MPAAGPPVARALVPAKAVRQEDGSSYVFVVKGDRVERRAVTAGAVRDQDVEIMAGVGEGDRVIVGGPRTLKDGERVQPRK